MDSGYVSGMYVIDRDFKVKYFSDTVANIYPEMKKGEYCYKVLAYRDNICPHCPIIGAKKQSTFPNVKRGEKISAQAAEVELPQLGSGYAITFIREKLVQPDVTDDSQQDKRVLPEMLDSNDRSGMIGGYCEDGFPLYFVNKKLISMMGYDGYDDFNEGIKGLVGNTIHPDDMEQVMRDIGGEYYLGLEYVTTYRMPRKDGTWFWVLDKGRVVNAEDGRLAIISVCTDISDVVSESARLEEQNALLQQQNRLMEFINDGLPGGYHRCADAEGYPLLYISNKFIRMLGFTREEIREKFDGKYMNLVHPDDKVILESATKEVSKGTGSSEMSVHYRIKTSTGYMWVVDTTSVSEYNGSKFFQGVIIDVSEEQRMKEHIESLNAVQLALREALEREQKYRRQANEALDEAKSASRAKSAFLFNMSHDIRTPMNAIIGFTKIGQKNVGDPQKAADCFSKIEVSGNHLLRLLNDVLDMARIENGKLEFDEKEVDLIAYLNEICSMIRTEMDSHGLSFVTDFSGVRDRWVCCDSLRIGKVMMNLLSNAAKFTRTGGHVWLTVRQEESADESAVPLTVSVKDDGIGMGKDFIGRVFNEFERERNSTESRRQGTGLGLAIAKQIVDAYGGEITVQSEPDKGSEFVVRITLKKASPVSESSADVTDEKLDFGGKRALLVEDNELNREIASELISTMGVEIEEACDGRQAVDMVKASPKGYYSVVLMDVQMPVMDGYEATRQIRLLPRNDAAALPILAMTANAFAEDVDKARKAGMNDHIAKPVDLNVLGRMLKRYL